MPAQELQRRQREAPSTAPSTPQQQETGSLNAPRDSGFLRDIRSRIAQRSSQDESKGAANFTREELTTHAVNVVNQWAEQLTAMDPKSPEHRQLLNKIHLVSRTLIAADVYSDDARRNGSLPSHIDRLDANGVSIMLGAHFDASLLKGKFNGYSAALYYDRISKTIILANRGTSDPADWANNFKQAVGATAPQYRQAVDLAGSVKTALKEQYGMNASLEFVGHSLGGGIASLQAVVFPDCPAITFNAAGLHRNTVEDELCRLGRGASEITTKNISALRLAGDILSEIQEDMEKIFQGAIAPEAVGVPRVINPAQQALSGRPGVALAQGLERHMMHKVLFEVLRKEGVEPLDQDQKGTHR